MSQIKSPKRVLRPTVVIATALVAVLATFENCGQVAINKSSLSSQSLPVISLSENYITTTLNHPVVSSLDPGIAKTSLSLAQGQVQTNLKLANSTLILDPVAQTLTYTPNTGFRGTETAQVFSTYQNVTNVLNVTFEVVNPLLNFKPALAVRAAQCLYCHANVQGDLISDFGYKGASDSGPDLFFGAKVGGTAWISSYGLADNGGADNGQALATASIVGHFAIPQVDLTTLDPTVLRAAFPTSFADSITAGFTTLSQYVTNYALPKNLGFQGVTEQNQIYIGAPTVSDIKTAGQLLPGQTMNFFKNTVTDSAVTGFTLVQNGTSSYYTNSQTVPMVCEGDLFLDAPVFLYNLNLQTTYGCRIYSTHTVFINGPITYTNEFALSNLEVTSAIGVYMGFGYCVDCADASPTTFNYANQNTLVARWNDIRNYYSIPSYRTLGFEDEINFAEADYAAISNTPTSPIPPPPAGQDPVAYYQQYAAANNLLMFDASNSFISQGPTTYTHLLLNAPVVMSRYTGNFQGIVIAEYALWRLSQFTFAFDPVFTGVTLLPFLDFTKILNVQ